MQTLLSRIWTRVAVSISYDDNYYTTGTSKSLPVYNVCDDNFVTVTLHKTNQ